MRANLRSHLTYANVMASIAVFVALGGSGYAAVKINGKDITNRSIAGKKLKKNTLGGKQVNESKLATVPTANNARLLGGRGPDAFLARGAKAADADKLDGQDSTAFLGVSDRAADADLLDGKDSAEFLGATAKAADADSLDGRDSAEFLGRGSGTASNAVGLQWYSYFGDTATSTDYGFGQMKLRTTGVAGEFQICGNTGSASLFNWVRYVNGVRAASTVAGNACTAAFDVGAGGDFQVQMRRSIVFGVHSGDSTVNEKYLLYGFGQL